MKQIKNGFKESYYLMPDGRVYNQEKDKYLKADKYKYHLKTAAGTDKTVSIKTLYRLVYHKNYCKDTIELLPGEEFKEIEGTEGLYLISNLGRVKSLIGYEAAILKPSMTKKGYLRLQIIQEGYRINKLLHCLVAAAWLDKPKSLEVEIHHKDFDKLNNAAANLEYLTKVQHIKKHQERKELQNIERYKNSA